MVFFNNLINKKNKKGLSMLGTMGAVIIMLILVVIIGYSLTNSFTKHSGITDPIEDQTAIKLCDQTQRNKLNPNTPISAIAK